MAHSKIVGKLSRKMSQAEILKSRGEQLTSGSERVAARARRRADRARREAEQARVNQIWKNCEQIESSRSQ